MKYPLLLLILILTGLTFSACAPAAPLANVATAPASGALALTFPDAANLRSQLAYGILKLDGTTNAITLEQAKTLIPLWQAVVTLSGDNTTASAELVAVQDQIAQTLTPAQLEAIAALKITNAELNSYYAQFGLSVPTPVPGETKVPGSKQNMSEADKLATRTAAEASGVSTGSGQAVKKILFEQVLIYLATISK